MLILCPLLVFTTVLANKKFGQRKAVSVPLLSHPVAADIIPTDYSVNLYLISCNDYLGKKKQNPTAVQKTILQHLKNPVALIQILVLTSTFQKKQCSHNF